MCVGIGFIRHHRGDAPHPGIIRKIQVQTEKRLCTARPRQTLAGGKILIRTSGQENLYLRGIHRLKSDQMGNLKDYSFLGHVVNADPAGVVAAVPGVYHDGERAGLADPHSAH